MSKLDAIKDEFDNSIATFDADKGKIIFNLDGAMVKLQVTKGVFRFECRVRNIKTLKSVLTHLIEMAPAQRCAECGSLLDERGRCCGYDCNNTSSQTTSIRDVKAADIVVGDMVAFRERYFATDSDYRNIELPPNQFYRVVQKDVRFKRFDLKITHPQHNATLDVTVLESETLKTIVPQE